MTASNFTPEQNAARNHIVESIGAFDDLNIGRIEGYIAALISMKGAD